MRDFADPHWLKFVDIWQSGQFQLDNVVRYSRYMKEDPELMRRQTTLQHSYSVTMVGSMLCRLLWLHGALINEALLLNACLIHDHGEGELKRDVMYVNKGVQDDLDEYRAFVERFHHLGSRIFDHYHRAYLLDAARPGRSIDWLPPEAQKIVQELRENDGVTIMAFYAVERWDYLLHALFHLREFNNVKLAVQVLRNQLSHLDRIAQALPGFRVEIWTPDFRQWCVEFLAQYEGQFIEQKG